MSAAGANPQANFEASIPSFGGYISQPDAIEGAGFWIRAGARAIDYVFYIVLSAIGGLTFGLMLAVVSNLTGEPLTLLQARTQGIFTVILYAVATVIYETFCEGFHGSTLGKLMMGLVVVQEDGSPCRMKSALIRSLAYFIDSLFFGIIGYLAMQKNIEQQRYGDQWAETVVCKKSKLAIEKRRGFGRFVGAFILACIAFQMCVMAGFAFNILVSR